MNSHQFRKVMWGYEQAQELLAQNLYKQARLELNPGLKILESSRVKTPLLARYYLLYESIYTGLNEPDKAAHYHELAQEILDATHAQTRSNKGS